MNKTNSTQNSHKKNTTHVPFLFIFVVLMGILLAFILLIMFLYNGIINGGFELQSIKRSFPIPNGAYHVKYGYNRGLYHEFYMVTISTSDNKKIDRGAEFYKQYFATKGDITVEPRGLSFSCSKSTQVNGDVIIIDDKTLQVFLETPKKCGF